MLATLGFMRLRMMQYFLVSYYVYLFFDNQTRSSLAMRAFKMVKCAQLWYQCVTFSCIWTGSLSHREWQIARWSFRKMVNVSISKLSASFAIGKMVDLLGWRM